MGPKKAALLQSIGIASVRDLLFYLPQRYWKRGALVEISALRPGDNATVQGVVGSPRLIYTRRPWQAASRPRQAATRPCFKIFELSLTDGTGSIKCKWFNQPFLKNRFKTGDRLLVSGREILWNPYERCLEIESPDYEFLPDAEFDKGEIPGIVPVYGLTKGLHQRFLRGIIRAALKEYHGAFLRETLPHSLLERLKLPGLEESVFRLHMAAEDGESDGAALSGSDGAALSRLWWPGNLEELNTFSSPYQKRLAFEELFLLELGLLKGRAEARSLRASPFKNEGPAVKQFLSGLPFELTRAQKRELARVFTDLSRPHPMRRLLQGDVGSGKTVIALAAIAAAAQSGFQSAFMAPTALLAEQHYINHHRTLEALGVRTALFTGGEGGEGGAAIKEALAGGGIQVAIGTHALISERVSFKKLGLVVVDEQHKFGVLQRRAAVEKGEDGSGAMTPHLLVMTATPIPRTLMMSLYGDLDCSRLDEVPCGTGHPGGTGHPVGTGHPGGIGHPGGRPRVETELVYADKGKKPVYDAISEELSAGGQVYVVYPVIEGDGESKNLKSAVEGHSSIKRMYPGARVGLLHGRMPREERERLMLGMRERKIDILVSTTVVEVGIDVPRASLMVITHAERFGLGQLHQLRGRVGRSAEVRRARCILLVYPPVTEEARGRLQAMLRTGDGFEIAEEDLNIRGPGEVLGTRQSGLPEMRVADLARDKDLLELAAREARAFFRPDGVWPEELRLALDDFWRGRDVQYKSG